MLSQSSSTNGASHLRRAKSTPSVQRRVSNSSLFDPVAAKQHAIVAATLAYERAHGRDSADNRSNELGRRRSHRTGRSEGQGSHFEANHAPRHQSSKKISPATSSSNDHPRSQRATMSSLLPQPKHIDHQRHTDVNCSKTIADVSSKEDGSTLNIRRVRKSRSMLTSSALELATSIDAISFDVSSPQPNLQPFMRCTDETTTCVLGRDMTDGRVAPQIPPVPLTHTTIYKVDERVAKARDHHLQQFQMQRLRHRASSLLTPFKKRVASNELALVLSGESNNGVTHGSGRTSPTQEIWPLQPKATCEGKQSTSLKEKIRRVFRKPSSLQTSLPVQQVEASRAHFGDLLTPSSRVSTIRAKASDVMKYGIPGTQGQASATPTMRSGSGEQARPRSRAISETTMTTSASRVTSWADSTIDGTTASRGSNPLTIIHEDIQQPEVSSVVSQKRSSLSLLRRGTKHNFVPMEDVDTSPRIETNEFVKAKASISDYESRFPSLTRKASVHDTLPSQVRRSSLSCSRASNMMKATVRVVSSASHSTTSCGSSKQRNAAASMNALSVLTPSDTESQNQALELPSLSSALGWREKRKQNRLQKLQKEREIVAPSAELIAARVEKSHERWKQSLDEGQSLFFPGSSHHVSTDRQHNIDGSTKDSANRAFSSAEDVFMAAREPPTFRSLDVISPSLYSRNTNSASPRRHLHDSAVSLESTSSTDTGTAVITTSHPIIKYSVGSPKRPEQHLAKTSRDWRDWISNQVHDLGTPPPEDLTLSTEYVCRPADSGHRREHAQIVDGEDVSIGSIPVDSIECLESRPFELPPIQLRPKEPCSYPSFGPDDRPSSRLHDRPGLKDRSASCMNERFPLINTGRPFIRKTSPPTDSVRSKKVENVVKTGTDENISPSSSTLRVPITKNLARTVLRRPQSTNSFYRSRSSLAYYTTSGVDNQSQAKSTSRVPIDIAKTSATPLNRPKSALDIRAARRNRIPPTPIPNVDTDPTLAAIFKGPYRDGTASPRPLSIRKSTSFYKENSPFPKEVPSPVRTVSEDDNSSLMLPSTPTSGQRLAEQFLTTRRLKSEMRPSASPSTVGSPVFL
jgi:hypothetical protein